jgi:hypothetical protein
MSLTGRPVGRRGLVLSLLPGMGVLVIAGALRPAGLVCRSRPAIVVPAGSLLATEVWL